MAQAKQAGAGGGVPAVQSKPKKERKPRSDAFQDLKRLYCFKEMDDKVKAGVAIEEVARWLQEDCFAQTEIKRDSLVRKLYRYKQSLPPADLVRHEPLYIQKAIEKLRRGVSELDEMEKLYLLQLKRISIDAQTEERITKLFSGTNSEIRLAADLLVRMMNLKQELGIVQKVPDQVTFSGAVGIAPLVDEETDEQTKAKLGLLAGKLLDTLGKAVKEKEEELSLAEELGLAQERAEENDYR